MAYRSSMTVDGGVDPFQARRRQAPTGPFAFGQAPQSGIPRPPAPGELAKTTPIAADSTPFGFSPYAGLQAQRAAADVDADGHTREGFTDPSQYLNQGELSRLGWTGGNGTDPNQSAMSQENAPSLQNNQAFTDFLAKNQYSLNGGMLPGNEQSTGYLTDPSGKHLAQGTYDGSDGGLFMGLAAAGLGGFGLQAAGLGAGAGAAGGTGGGGSAAFGALEGLDAAAAAEAAGGAGSGALGIPGATYAMPGAEAGMSLANVGATAAEAAPGVLPEAVGSDALASFIPGADSAATGIAGAATAPSAVNLGSLGGIQGTGSTLAGGLSNLSSALSGIAAPASQFLKDNPTLGRFAEAAAAAGGAGLVGKALSGNPPASINAGQVAQQQTAANLTAAQQQAQLNRVDTTTPFGFQKFGQVADPSVPGGFRYTQDIGFSPEQKKLYDAETSNQLASQGIAGSLQGRVAQSVANPLDLSGAGQMERALSADQFSADRDKVSSALFSRLTSLRKPQMDRDKAHLDVQLRNQGLMPGTEAYDNSMRTLLETQGSELSNAANQAIAAGGAEQSRLQGDSRANSSLNNNVRSQSIQEKLLERQQPLAEYNSFRTGNTPTLPAFQPFGMGSVAPANTLAASNSQYQTEADAYNARIAKLQSLLNFGVAASKP